MLLFSKLRRFELEDRQHRRARLVDLALALLEKEDHPPITRLLFHDSADGGKTKTLPWDTIESVDWRAERIRVPDLSAGEALPDASATPPAGAASRDVLLHRDILDALVLDLQNRRATRANDLALRLEEGGNRLRLVGADTSLRAMLRRVSGARLGKGIVESKLFDWKYVEFLRGDPAAVQRGAGYQRRIARLPAGEIARLVDALPYLHAAELLTLLEDKLAADVLEAMSPQRQLQVFEELDDDKQVALLGLMAPDLAADLAGRLHTEPARKLLDALPPARSARIVELLRYAEDTVGGIMTNDVLFVPASLTVAEARAALREPLREPDFIFFIYVVEDEASRRLRGVITLRALVTAPETQRIEEIMNPYLVTLRPREGARDAAYRVLNSRLAALPVVNRDGRLLGALTVDEAVAQVAPASFSAQVPRIFS